MRKQITNLIVKSVGYLACILSLQLIVTNKISAQLVLNEEEWYCTNDSNYVFDVNVRTTSATPIEKTIQFYNGTNRIASYNYYIEPDASLQLNYVDSFTYDGNNRQSVITRYEPTASSLYPIMKSLYSYHTNQQVALIETLEFDTTINRYEKKYAVLLEYSNELITELKYQIFNAGTNVYEDYIRYVITYTSFDSIASYTMQLKNSANAWENIERELSYYNSQLLKTKTEFQTYAIAINNWNNKTTKNYSYFDSNGSHTIEYIDDVTTLHTQTDSVFCINNLPTNVKLFDVTATSTLLPKEVQTYTYDSGHKITAKMLFNRYNETTGRFTKATEWKYYCRTNTGTSIPEIVNDTWNFFPNPIQQGANIFLHNKTQTELRIINTIGTIVESKTLPIGNHVISIQNLKPGIYFIQKDNQTKKIIIQ